MCVLQRRAIGDYVGGGGVKEWRCGCEADEVKFESRCLVLCFMLRGRKGRDIKGVDGREEKGGERDGNAEEGKEEGEERGAWWRGGRRRHIVRSVR